MTKGKVKLFRDKYLLSEMLALRANNFSLTSLALIYDCDRDSIANWCDRYGVKPNQDVYTIERIIMSIIEKPESKWKIVAGERVHKPMMYKDYLISSYKN